jgi:competence protein ComEC
VLEEIDVGFIIDPAVPTGKDIYVDLLAQARSRGAPWLAGRAGRELDFDGMTLSLLAPEDSLLDDGEAANDFSLVVRLAYGRFGALFLGDAPRRVENQVVARFGRSIASDVVKVGHHGSRTSTGDSLLDRVQPRVALISVGRRNRYGHPDPTVLARLARRGVRVLRTDSSGVLLVRADAAGRLELAVQR